MSELPALEHFFGGYLYECWTDEYTDVWAATDDFARSEPGSASKIGPEIREVLKAKSTEAELEQVFEDLYGNYRPEIHGQTYRGWLTAVAERVDQVLGEQQQP